MKKIFSSFFFLLFVFPILSQASISNYLTGIVTAAPKDQGYSVLDMEPGSVYMQKREAQLAQQEAERREAEEQQRLAKAQRYFGSDEHIKEFIYEGYHMRPDSSGSTKDNKFYFTCTKHKAKGMTDREHILQDDYIVDVILSISNAKIIMDDGKGKADDYRYLFSSEGVDIYKSYFGKGAFFVDKSKNLKKISLNYNSLSVEVITYKCSDPSMVKLLKMKAKNLND